MGALIPLPINPPPGVVATESERVAEGRWIPPMDKVRFVRGKPQKLGGNSRITSTAMSGTPRATLCWQDFLQNGYVACGTFRKLYAFDSSFALNDITPFRATGTLGSNPFGFTSASASVTVTHTAHGVNVGDTAIFAGSATSATVSGAVAGTGGVIKLTVNSSTGMTTGDSNVVVSGVGGTTEANGTWTITVVDSTHISLSGSTFVHAYTSGGSVSDPFTYGVNMNGTFVCVTVTGPNAYTVTAANAANGTASAGGSAVTFEYEIAIGTELGAFGQGWGTGPWGLGTWGTPRGSSTIFFEPRVWSLDYFGQVLVASYNGGSLWFFDPTQNQPWPRAVATFNSNPVSGAPTNIRTLFVSPERFIFTTCANMVVNVSSQGDPTTWTPASSNTAFARTLQVGSKLVGGRALAPYLSMIWSDNAAYLFQYTGSQFLYNSSMVGRDCGLVSPNAVAVVDGIAYWMGPENFYFYNGSVQPMPNVEDVRSYIFPNIPSGVAFQATAVYIPKYHEIRWYYTTTGNTNPSNYVAFHINDQCWSVGAADFYSSTNVTTGHASGSHFTAGDTSPILAGTDGYLYQADETGVNDDNGTALTWTLTLAPFLLKEGMQNVDLEGIRFDFFEQSGAISATVNTFDELTDSSPMDSETESIPDSQAGMTDFRVSGRFMGLTLSQGVLGGYMRLGKPTAFVRGTATRRG